MGTVYFLYYLFPLTQDSLDTSTINFDDFGNQYLSVAVIVAFFIYLIQIGRFSSYLASPERNDNLKSLKGAIDKLFTYVKMSPIIAPSAPQMSNEESSHIGKLLKHSYHTFGGQGNNSSFDGKSSNYLFHDATDKSMGGSQHQ
jgi:hypothetical protein